MLVDYNSNKVIYSDILFFINFKKEELGYLEMVIYFDISIRINLEFLLRWYDFGVDIGNFDIGVEISFLLKVRYYLIYVYEVILM